MEQELELSAVIGFQGTFAPTHTIRQGDQWLDSAPRQRAHHLPPGHDNRRQTHHLQDSVVP